MFRFYNRGKYIEQYEINEDGTETCIKYWRILEKHTIDAKPYNFRIFICTDMKSHTPIWFKVIYFTPYDYKIEYCDDETKLKYDYFGDTFDKKIR